MKPNAACSRREALHTLGAGAALLGLGALTPALTAAEKSGAKAAPATPAAPKAPKTPPPQPFTLPPLPYAYDALEPHIDARTMELHHAKHHQAYIDSANRALAEFPELQKKTAEELLKTLNTLPEKARAAVRNQVGGHVNHTLFWQLLSPQGGRAPVGDLAQGINLVFGSFDAFKARFTDVAMKRFGSGWAWLSFKPGGSLELHSTANQDSPLSEGLVPLLGLDVWEHAYYLKHQNLRLNYVQEFWQIIDWRKAEANYDAARA
ncbi:MAG: superoxide dismutase [Opitutae bacterium]|nr:superoxide dismutase [Opitutae bacterium]